MPEVTESQAVNMENPPAEFNAGQKLNFPEVVRIEPCSYNVCVNGHKWPPQLAIGQCPGCGGSFLAVRMINCPQCNEPTVSMQLRTDHTCPGMGIAATCRGQKGLSETMFIRLDRGHAAEAIEKWDEKTGRMVI